MTDQSHVEPLTVIARITFFDPIKHFGFAEVVGAKGPNNSPIRVFFHDNCCREIHGTTVEPVFTKKRAYITPRADPQMLVAMRVKPGKKGRLAANAWGILPERNWQLDIIEAGGLSHYIGGRVVNIGNIGSVSDPNISDTVAAVPASRHIMDYRGFLDEIQVTATTINFILYPAEKFIHSHGHYAHQLRTMDFSYPLYGSSYIPLPDGRFTVEVLEGDTKRHLTFSPPEKSPTD